MTPTQITEIIQLTRDLNHVTTDIHSEHYAHLCERAQRADGLEEFLAKYARLIEMGPAATTRELHELATRLPMPLPTELHVFFQCIGGLRLPPLHIHSARSLLEFLNDSSDGTGTSFGASPKSLGLVDMIKFSWGNTRPELDPANGLVQQYEIDILNARYTSIGWYRAAGEHGYESATYVFFDQDGNFGTAFYHQDQFNVAWKDVLQPLLTTSPEHKSLSEIVMAALWGTVPQEDIEYEYEESAPAGAMISA